MFFVVTAFFYLDDEKGFSSSEIKNSLTKKVIVSIVSICWELLIIFTITINKKCLLNVKNNFYS